MNDQGGHGDLAPVARFDWPEIDRRRRFVVDSDGEVSKHTNDWRGVEIYGAVVSTLTEVGEVVCRRHQKYGPLNIAASPGGPLNGLRVRLFDKLARLNNAIDSGEHVDYADDSFRDCFADIVGYGLIGLLVLDGAWPGA